MAFPIFDYLSIAANPQRFQKKRIAMQVLFADESGFCATLEGEVPYQKGDAILTGTHGESWPIKRSVFDKTYQQDEDGRYYKKPLPISAIQLDQAIQLTRQDGSVLKGQKGDWVVEYAPGDQAIVRADIFEQTYEPID
ncbi:MAG: PGDYG domain-containing protein [Thiomicrospira sp.]|jgi:hypothetical protein|nr:PGDYG domain-containing protein [Thiomicrospira sp.]